MCGLCGVAGVEGHWTDAPEGAGLPLRQLRYRRIAAANRLLRPCGLSLGDFHGAQYILGDRVGHTAMLTALPELWPLVDGMARRPPDPLDPAYIAALEALGDG